MEWISLRDLSCFQGYVLKLKISPYLYKLHTETTGISLYLRKGVPQGSELSPFSFLISSTYLYVFLLLKTIVNSTQVYSIHYKTEDTVLYAVYPHCEVDLKV